MTLLEIQNELARETNKYSATLNPEVKARFLAVINRWYRALASLPGLQHLRDTTGTFSSVAAQALYQVASVAKIKRIWDPANRRYLLPMSMDEYRRLMPEVAADNQGTPTHWVWIGNTGGASPTFDFYLYPTPDSIIAYSTDVTSVLTPLANDSDVPILPADFHDLLYLGPLTTEYRHMDDTRAADARAEYQERLKSFKYWMHETDSGSSSVSGNEMARPSRLGAWFPSGS